MNLKQLLSTKLHKPMLGAKDILKYIGPGLLVTVGFIDPGNWASNLAAGSGYGYELLWMTTLSTLMLIVLQHNAAHLGIATGDCLAESAAKHLRPAVAQTVLATAVLAAVATALAEILGGAVALQLLWGVPMSIGTAAVLSVVLWMIFSSSYRRLEKWIIGFVSVIGLSFLYELSIIHVDWADAARGWLTPCLPPGSIVVVMSVLGAVVMPHNLFLHSEIIQSREWHKESPAVMQAQLKYEFLDTLFSMLAGWAINSAMIILAASAFYLNHTEVSELSQAKYFLEPLLGKSAALVFSVALLCSGISSSATAGMAGGSIFAGMFKEPYDIKDIHTKLGVAGVLCAAALFAILVADPFKGLLYSQMMLSIQLPFTVFLQIYLTSSGAIMGRHKNSLLHSGMLWAIGIVVTILNVLLLKSFF